MKHTILALTILLALASSAHAQLPDPDPITKYLQRSYTVVAKDLVAAIEMMPEEDFGFRPAGVAKEVRSFGAIVYHIVSVNSWVCSMGEGKPDPISALGAAAIVDKARLVGLLNDTNTRCSAYLATLTDFRLAEVVTTTSAAQQLQAVRGNAIMFAIAHSNEHYGNLVTYLRVKGLVPPATPSQASFLSLVKKSDKRPPESR
jgi:uncharacterized damage-inducible protein DinB